MPGQMKQGRQKGIKMMRRAVEGGLKNFKGAISAGERELLSEMLKEARPGIRGMNSQTRIDMLKQPKFRK
jgi:hypothetical protein